SEDDAVKMAHGNPNGRSGNAPLGSLPPLGNPYIYSNYIDPARLDGAAPANIPPSAAFMVQTPAASGSSAVAKSLGSDHRTQNAPNTAASDRSFHAIMIGDNGAQTPAQQSSMAAAAAASSHAPLPGLHLRPKQGFDMGNVGGVPGFESGSSLPSGNPFLHSNGNSGDAEQRRMSGISHARLAYPPLNIVSGAEWAAALPSPSVSQLQHTRSASQQYAPQQQQQQQHFSELSQATGASTYYSAAMHNPVDLASQRWPQAVPNSVYQAVTIGDVSRAVADADYAQQQHPVSQPGLPPLGPASASLSAYAAAAATHSPLAARGRSRRRHHQTYDYPDSNATGTYSSESSPAPTSTLPPGVRQTLSTSSFAESAVGMGDSRVLGRRGSELNVSMHSLRDSECSSHGASHGYSPSAALAVPTGGASSATRATPTYTYPEVAYSRPGDAPHVGPTQGGYMSGHAVALGRGHTASTAIANASDRTESRMANVMAGSDYALGHGNTSMASDDRYLQPPTQYGSASAENQYQEYANSMAPMAHMRWSQGSVASPLRTELSASNAIARDTTAPADLPHYTHEQQAQQQYATLPRSGHAVHGAVRHGNGSGERGQIPPLIATNAVANNSILLQPWPPASPQIRVANNSGSRAIHQLPTAAHGAHPDSRAHNVEASPDHGQAQGTPNILSDYYMVTSPNGQQLTEPSTPATDSTSILPMVEVGQGGIGRMPASDMDEINAHSQEYLHRRRRRLTQTLHNRQRSGSAVDVVSRLSATRLNALPMSSPGTTSLTSNRSMEEVQSVDSDQNTAGRQRYQPPPAPSSSAAYAGASMSHLQDELYSAAVMQAQAQAQAQTLAHIQAQAQADYLQRLQLERIQQERMQQERIRQEHIQATALEQQRQKAKLAQEQELARFSEFRPLLNLTVYIAETYRKCHVDFSYDSARRPRRVLTDPSEGVENDGFDNKNSDYILYVNDVIGEKDGHQFLILEMLGSGTFGQVVKCQNTKTGELVAVKVIKNKPAYYKQSMMEVQMLLLLNSKYDIDDSHHILRLKESFVFRNHLVFVNELLSINLYDLLKQNLYQGLSTNLVRVLVQQILDAMIVLKQAEIIHADLKPENILLEDMEKPVVKVIDFGSACFEWQTSFTYIQSRFYRSPEILLGLPYSSRIDMWSLGCIVAELYLGLPLFPGSSEYNQLSRIIDLLGLPPTNMLERARRTDEFFNYLGPSTWDLKSMVQYAREHNVEEKQSKRYFNATTLEELITTYPIRRRMTEAEQQREFQLRFALIDFLRGLLHLDPDKRWSPQQAAMHPFITGEPSVGVFVPPSLAGGGGSGSHGPGSGSQSYGDPAGSHHGRGHGHSAGADYTAQSGNGRYESLRSLGGYPSHHGANGHSACSVQNGGTGLGGDGAATGYQHISQQPNNYTGLVSVDNSPRIPGSFPIGSGQSSLAGPQLARQESDAQLRTAMIGHHSGGTAMGHSNAYSRQHVDQQSGFLGVDPSASQLSDLLTADSDSRGAPGRLDTPQCSSEYSAESSFGWTTRSESNHAYGHGSTGAPSVAGSYSTRAGSLHEYKMTGSALQRHFLFNERQQQRLAQQRQLARGDFAPAAAPTGQCDGDGDFSLLSRAGGRRYCGSLAGGKSNSSSSMTSERSGTGKGHLAVGEQALASSNGTTLNQASPAPRCFAAAQLVSNFSPLTVPSTPGSLGSGQQYGVGSVDSKLGPGNWSNAFVGRIVGPSEYRDDNFSDGSGDYACDNEDDDEGCQFSVGSGISRPLTQARLSDESLSMYSASSGQDACSGHGNGGRRSGGSNGSWTDGLSSWGSEGSGSRGFFETPMSISRTHTVRGSLDVPPPHAQMTQSLGRTPWALLENGIKNEDASSIYQLPQYAAFSQEVLGRGGSTSFTREHTSTSGEFVEFLESDGNASPSAELVADSSWVFDDYESANNVGEGSVISQEDASEQSLESLPRDDLEDAASILRGLDMNQLPPEACNDVRSIESSDSETAARESDGCGELEGDGGDDADSDCDDDDDDDDQSGDDDDAPDQDIVLFAGKLHPPHTSAAVSKDSQRTGLVPLSRGSRCGSFASSYPQRIAKKSHLRRSDRLPPSTLPAPPLLLIKDSLRMVESLRRMGKWQDSVDLVQNVAHASRANQFYLDPVIIAMSPRLMPPSGQQS
ncbi:dual specificity protein kinase yak1, partial [Coemansia sp. BCRC 34301]